MPTEEELGETAHDIIESIDDVEKVALPLEYKEVKDVWYVIMRYRIRTKFWYMWSVFFLIELVLTGYYLGNESSLTDNIFANTCLWFTFWSSFFQMLQYIKCWLYETYRYKYECIQGHERETIDITLHLLDPVGLTEKAKNIYGKVEIGADLMSFAYKTLHLETAAKMNYSLEQIMQA